ncbi:hypothetical protein TPB0596_42230 [Tsukamurella pulmonis]|nr:hypothetical protein TPB0596_42230 [Tsukamurella pulmonis]
MNLEPIDELVRPIDVEEEHDDAPALPPWVEDYFADQRRYWRTLRDDGIVDLADTGELIRRQVERPSGRQPASKRWPGLCTDGDSEEQR